jgi:hypothetical protein
MNNDFGSQILGQLEAGAQKALPDLLMNVAGSLLGGGNNLLANVEHGLSDALDGIGGHTAGNELGRSLCKHVDAALQVDTPLTPAQKLAVAQGLAENAAVQLEQAAKLLRGYPALQQAVVIAPDGTSKDAARTPRNAAVVAIKSALSGVVDAVEGNVATTPAPVVTTPPVEKPAEPFTAPPAEPVTAPPAETAQAA